MIAALPATDPDAMNVPASDLFAHPRDAAAALDAWAERARVWRAGSEPADLPRIATSSPPAGPRDVFICFISAARERNPAAAMALLERVQDGAGNTAAGHAET